MGSQAGRNRGWGIGETRAGLGARRGLAERRRRGPVGLGGRGWGPEGPGRHGVAKQPPCQWVLDGVTSDRFFKLDTH